MTKPFKIAVLLARMRAHLRQHEQSDDAIFSIGPYSFRPSAKILLDEATNKKIRLTEKETAILKYLYRTGDRMVKRETLLNEVWGYNAGVTTHTLETHVSAASENRTGPEQGHDPRGPIRAGIGWSCDTLRTQR